jgi:ribosomal protein S21
MAYVSLNDGESPESLINRFRSAVQRSGILRELKNRRYHKTKSQKAREAAQRAARRARRRRVMR